MRQWIESGSKICCSSMWGRDLELSSANDAEGSGLCLLQKDLPSRKIAATVRENIHLPLSIVFLGLPRVSSLTAPSVVTSLCQFEKFTCLTVAHPNCRR